MGNVDDIVVALFLVHGCHDLVDFGIDGGVIALSPVEQHILMHGCRIEVVGAAY